MAERKVIRPIPRRYKLAGVLAAIAVLYGATLLFSRLVMPAPRTALPPHAALSASFPKKRLPHLLLPPGAPSSVQQPLFSPCA